MDTYRKRIVDTMLLHKLEAMGGVLIEGPKECGKTTTALQIARSTLFLLDPATTEQNLMMAKILPSHSLKGATPRLIDEWQSAPQLWNGVRFEIDMRSSSSQFILTGSSVPAADMSLSHTGTGRITRMRMRPMSLFESGDSDGSVSLKELFSSQPNIAATSDLDITRIAFLICRGGWPKAIGQPEKIVLQQAKDYYDAIVESDISRPDGISRNPPTSAKSDEVLCAIHCY